MKNLQDITQKIKEKHPLILNITNMVTMDFIANGLHSLGASPLMSNAPKEIADLLQITDAVIINIGTLHSEFIDLCLSTCKLANKLNKPIILDPVGVGASSYRTAMCKNLLNNFHIAIVRGNASEITALAGMPVITKGVDNAMKDPIAITQIQELATKHATTIVISGATDIVLNKHHTDTNAHGSALMPYITGTGCLLSAIIGAFHTVIIDPFDAAMAAVRFYGLCGEIAATKAIAPGSFKIALLDALYQYG